MAKSILIIEDGLYKVPVAVPVTSLYNNYHNRSEVFMYKTEGYFVEGDRDGI